MQHLPITRRTAVLTNMPHQMQPVQRNQLRQQQRVVKGGCRGECAKCKLQLARADSFRTATAGHAMPWLTIEAMELTELPEQPELISSSSNCSRMQKKKQKKKKLKPTTAGSGTCKAYGQVTRCPLTLWQRHKGKTKKKRLEQSSAWA